MNAPVRALLALAIALCGALPARAIGLGIYTSGSGMSSEIKGNGSRQSAMGVTLSYPERTVQGSGFAGFGLMMDTAAARDQLFGARVQMGMDLFNSATPEHARLFRFYGACTFGFGIIRNKTLRFWLGPQVGLAVHSRSVRYTNFFYLPMGSIVFIPEKGVGRLVTLGISVGAALGINIHVAEAVSLSLEAGFRYNLAFKLTAYEGYGTVGVLFRIRDSFNRPLEPLALVRGSLPDSADSSIIHWRHQ